MMRNWYTFAIVSSLEVRTPFVASIKEASVLTQITKLLELRYYCVVYFYHTKFQTKPWNYWKILMNPSRFKNNLFQLWILCNSICIMKRNPQRIQNISEKNVSSKESQPSIQDPNKKSKTQKTHRRIIDVSEENLFRSSKGCFVFSMPKIIWFQHLLANHIRCWKCTKILVDLEECWPRNSSINILCSTYEEGKGTKKEIKLILTFIYTGLLGWCPSLVHTASFPSWSWRIGWHTPHPFFPQHRQHRQLRSE